LFCFCFFDFKPNETLRSDEGLAHRLPFLLDFSLQQVAAMLRIKDHGESVKDINRPMPRLFLWSFFFLHVLKLAFALLLHSQVRFIHWALMSLYLFDTLTRTIRHANQVTIFPIIGAN
jgi:hypothetical protein